MSVKGTNPQTLTNQNGTELVLQPEDGVTIINCVGGAGMTLSFGLCDEIVGKGPPALYLLREREGEL